MSDINELFNRDPLSLTREDIDQIIEKMRSMRHLFNQRPAGSAKPKKLTAAQTKLAKLDIDDDLKL